MPVQDYVNALLGLNGQERYQLWPERMMREALSAPQKAMTGEYGHPLSEQFAEQSIPGASAMAGFANLPVPAKMAPGGDALGTLFLRRKPTNRRGEPLGQNEHGFDIIDDKGTIRAPLDVEYPYQKTYRETDPSTVHVNYIGGHNYSHGVGPQMFGASDVRSLLMALRDQFPDAKAVTGYRVSGARQHSGALNDAQVRIPNIPPDLMKNYLTMRDKVFDQGVKPAERLTNEQAWAFYRRRSPGQEQ